MGCEIPGQFKQKKGLTICAKGNNAQNHGGADDAADQLALAGESGIGKWHTSRSLLGTRLTTVYLGLCVGSGFIGVQDHREFFSSQSPQPRKPSGLRVVRSPGTRMQQTGLPKRDTAHGTWTADNCSAVRSLILIWRRYDKTSRKTVP